jgi:hypothetical protein
MRKAPVNTDGTDKKNTWALTKEDKGAAKPAATLTAEQQAAADALASSLLAKKAIADAAVITATTVQTNASTGHPLYMQ